MINDPQDDLLDLIRQEFAKALKEKRGGLHIEKHCHEVFKVYALIDGHLLWNVGLNRDHDTDCCDKCHKDKVNKGIITED